MHKALNANQKKIHLAAKSVVELTDDKLRHLAFDNTVQANIITTVRDGKIILINNAASKLLGYSKKELLSKNRSDIFNIKESSFKKMLKQRTAEGYSDATVNVFKKNGKVIVCSITFAVFLDEDGCEKAITTIADMSESILIQKNIAAKNEQSVVHDIMLAKSKQKSIDRIKVKKVNTDIELAKSKQIRLNKKNDKEYAGNIILAQAKSDARLAHVKQWIKYISKISFDVMWDWEVATGKIYVGDSIKEVLGYSVRNNMMHLTDFCKFLEPGEKYIVEKKIMKAITSDAKVWDDAFMVKRSNGSFAYTSSRASIIRDEAGKVISVIGALQDVSRLLKLEQKIKEKIAIHKEDSDKFLLAAKLSFDVIWDWNLLNNEVFLGDGFEELFGYKIKNNKGDMMLDWVNYLHPDDKDRVIKEIFNTIKSPAIKWEQAYRVSRADGSIAKVCVRANIFRHADGKAYRIIGAMQDLSRQKDLEQKLEEEIELREKQIALATSDAKEMERADIGKELHDNINQLLGASKMYIDMAKRGGDNSAMYLSRSSEYTLAAIEEIRKLTKGLTTDIIQNLGLCDAIDNIVKDTMQVSPVKIIFTTDHFIEKSAGNNFKLNVFRIVQEQLNNILKHAEATRVSIHLLQNKSMIKLVISDNGQGFDVEKKQTGIGIKNIKSRVATYQGSAAFVSLPGHGCILTTTFPLTRELLSK